VRKLKKILYALVAVLFSVPITVYGAEAVTPTGVPISEVGSRIDEIVARYMHEFTPGFAIAVIHDGEIVFMQGYGYADIEQGMRVDPTSTIFSHASINKMFVWVSVMQLVEQGLIRLDDDIANYLPADLMRQFNFQYSFTMGDLMNHAAGFAEIPIYGDQNAEDVTVRKSLQEALIAFQPPQIYQPGTAKGYSNYGTALAAYIVSYVSGMSFSEYVRVNILEPLGMTSTRNQPEWFGDDEFAQNRARGGSQSIWTYTFLYPQGASAGTIEDLARFAIALTPPQGEPSPLFNSRSTLDLMLSPSYDIHGSPAFRGMAHGFLQYMGLYPTFGHAGSLPDVAADFAIVPSHRFGVMMFANSAGGGGGAASLIDKILDLTIGYSMDATLPVIEGLPDASRVTGSFLYLRLRMGNFREFGNAVYRYWQINAIDDNTITLSWVIPFGMGPDITITYRQVAPYLFRAIDATPDARPIVRGMYEIYFVMENSRPIRISTSWGFDAIPQTFMQSATAMWGSMIINFVIAVFFMITSIIVFIRFIRKKGQLNPFTHLSNGLIFCGLLLGINFLALEARYMTMPAPSFMPLNFATPHVLINWVLLIVIAVLFVASVLFWKKDAIATRRRVLYSSAVAALTLFLVILWQWNFFVIM